MYIRQRGETWSYTIDIGCSEDGKRLQKTKGGFKTEKAAIRAAAKIEDDVAKGLYVNETKEQFNSFADEWMNLYRPGVKQSTARQKDEILKLLKKRFEGFALKGVTRKEYQLFLNELLERGLSQSYMKSIHTTACLIFRKAKEFNQIIHDPTEYTNVPKKKLTISDLENNTTLPKFLEKKDLQKLLASLKEHDSTENFAIFRTLSFTGMRIGELLALKWTDVDIDNLTISITKTLDTKKRAMNYHLDTPKTLSSRRTIEIDIETASLIKKHKAVQNAIRLENPSTWHPGNFVFTSPKFPGYPACRNSIRKTLNKHMSAIGKEEITIHSFRHTHTSLLAAAGVTLEEIQDRLGHSSDGITKRIYLHITQDKKKEAAHKFAELMDGI